MQYRIDIKQGGRFVPQDIYPSYATAVLESKLLESRGQHVRIVGLDMQHGLVKAQIRRLPENLRWDLEETDIFPLFSPNTGKQIGVYTLYYAGQNWAWAAKSNRVGILGQGVSKSKAAAQAEITKVALRG